MDGGSSLDDQRRRLQREVQLLEQSLSNTDLHNLSSLSDESDSSDSPEDRDSNQDPSGLGPQSGLGSSLLEQRNLLHRQIQELERTLGPSSSFPEDHTDVDDEDEEDSSSSSSSDESEVELPRSVESCLQMNLVYQQVIEETLEQLEILLQQNTRQQKELMVQLSGPGSERDQPRARSSDQTPTNVYLGSFLKPYFKDRLTGLGPPSNAETREKSAQMLGHLDDQKLKIRRWEGWQKVLLIHAVSRDRLRKLIQPKLSKVDFLTQKLSSASDFDKVKIQEQIQTLEQEIQALREKKEEDLIGDRFEDVDWARISNIDFEGSREPTDLQCFWQNYLHPSINKERWSDNEIHNLEELSLKNQERNWTQISLELRTGRTAFMCLQTYQRFVSNSLRKRRWTPAEDAQLQHLVDKMKIGNYIPYTQMCYFMEDRLPSQLLYRWSQVLDPRLRKGPWSLHEDQLLLAAVEKHGAKNWWKIRFEVPGRTDTACRDRYLDCLRPGTKKGPFDQKERLLLRTLLQKYGVGCWSKIAAEIPNRTDAQCMRASRRLLQSRGSQDAGKETVEEAKEDTKKNAVLRMKKRALKTKSWEKSLRTDGLDAQKPPAPALTLKRSSRKRWRPKWRGIFVSDDEAEEEVPYMDISDEEKRNTAELSDSGEELDTVNLKREEKKPTAVKLEETTATTGEHEEIGVDRTNRESRMKLDVAPRVRQIGITEATGGATATWFRRMDITDWVSKDISRKSFSFRPVVLTPPGGGLCVGMERCTIVDRARCSMVVVGHPVELPWEQQHHSGVLMMMRSEDLSALLHLQVLKSSHRSGPKRQTETSLNYQLQAAVVPWIGHVVLRRDGHLNSSVPTERQNRDANVSKPMEQLQKGDTNTSAPTTPEQLQQKSSVPPSERNDMQISSTKLFRFFLHVLRVDAEGCKLTIEARQLQEQQGAETKVISHASGNAAAILGERRIKQEPKSPDKYLSGLLGSRTVQTAPILPALLPRPQMFTPFLPQLQNVRLLSHTDQNGDTYSSASLQNMKVLQPLPPASAPAHFTVIAPLWTSHSHQLPRYSQVNKVNISPPDNIPPPSSDQIKLNFSTTKANPPQTVGQGTLDDSASQKHNVRQLCAIPSTSSQAESGHPVPVLSSPSVHPVLSPSLKKKVHPDPVRSSPSVRPVLPSPPHKQKVRLFRDSMVAQKVHVIKVYPKMEKLDLEKCTRGSPSEGDVKTEFSSDSGALLDHCYTSRFNRRALSVPSSNQSAHSVALPNQMTPKKRGRTEGTEATNAEKAGAEAVSTEEMDAEEASRDGKRRRKLTMKALALHQDQVNQKQLKKRLSEKKQQTKSHKRSPSSAPPSTGPTSSAPPPTAPPSSAPPSSAPTSSAPTSSAPTSLLPYLILSPLPSDPSLTSGLPSHHSLASFPTILSSSSLCPASIRPSNPLTSLHVPLLPSRALLPVSASSLTSNASLCPNQTPFLSSSYRLSSNASLPLSNPPMTPSFAPLDLTKAPSPVSATSSSLDPTLFPSSASLPHSSASPLDLPKACLPVRNTSSSPNQTLAASNASLPSLVAPLPSLGAPSSPSLTPLTPVFTLAQPQTQPFPNPSIKSHPTPPSDVKPSELHDWLGAGRNGQAAVSRWLSGEGGVSAAVTNTKKLPYLPPFTCNLKTLSLLLRRTDELRTEAAKILRKPTGWGGDKTQIKNVIFQTVEAGESSAKGMSLKTPTQARSWTAKQAKYKRIKQNTAGEAKPGLGSKMEKEELTVGAGDMKRKMNQTAISEESTQTKAKSQRFEQNAAEEEKLELYLEMKEGDSVRADDAKAGESRAEGRSFKTPTQTESGTMNQANSQSMKPNVAEEAKPGLDSEMEEEELSVSADEGKIEIRQPADAGESRAVHTAEKMMSGPNIEDSGFAMKDDVRPEMVEAEMSTAKGKTLVLKIPTREESETPEQGKSQKIKEMSAEEVQTELNSEKEKGQMEKTEIQEETERVTANEKIQSQAEAKHRANQERATTHKLTNHMTQVNQQSAKKTHESRTADESRNEIPGTRHEQANQRQMSGSDPPSNQEPAKVELTEAVRRIVRESFGSNPAHQLLLARFLAIFTLPALLASLEPNTGQDEEEEGAEPSADQPITEADDVSDTDRRRSHDSGTKTARLK